jgi:hypothetical protein
LPEYVYLWIADRRVQRFVREARTAHALQRELLFAKLRRNADSDFGREHGFASVRSVEEYRRQVPIAGYERFRPYIDRVLRGDVGALFAPGTKLLMFALTSGSTGEAKHLPVTQEFFDEYRRSWKNWGIRTYVDHLEIANRRVVQLTSDWKQSYSASGVPCGNMSGLTAETAPRISRPLFLLPRSIWRIEEYAAKQYAILRLTLPSRRVGIIMTANPSTLIGLAQAGDRFREDLIRDLHDGGISPKFDIPPDVRAALRWRTALRHRRRARQLAAIVERTGHLHPRDYWTKLAVLAVWTGGSMGAYLPRLRDYYGEAAALRDHGLTASEGRMTIPLADGASAGVLDYTSHYYEFIPEDEYGSPAPAVLEAHELTPGRCYYIVLTTSGGLYRYDIQDLVRCAGFEGTAPLLEFLNKGSAFSSVAGEKLSEFQVVEAVRAALGELQLSLDLFTVAPQWGDPPGYVLLVEPLESAGIREEELARSIDAHLGRLNFEYAQRLESGRLRPLAVRTIAAGTWAAFRAARLAQRGGSLEQYKHPCLANDVAFVEQLLKARE